MTKETQAILKIQKIEMFCEYVFLPSVFHKILGKEFGGNIFLAWLRKCGKKCSYLLNVRGDTRHTPTTAPPSCPHGHNFTTYKIIV
jgi:hypothetical protein